MNNTPSSTLIISIWQLSERSVFGNCLNEIRGPKRYRLLEWFRISTQEHTKQELSLGSDRESEEKGEYFPTSLKAFPFPCIIVQSFAPFHLSPYYFPIHLCIIHQSCLSPQSHL